MVKKLIFIILSLFCTPAFGQSKCWCDSVYAHFEELMSNQLIMLWETPPDFKEHTDVYKIRMLLTRYNCAVKLVVDTLDTPKCIKFLPEIDPFVAESIINEIKECNFSAASVRNKKVVAPLYVVRLSYSCLDGNGSYYNMLPKPSEKHIQKFIKKNLRYPDTQIESGYVLIYILLDDKCNHIGYEMPKYSDSVFCNEALRVAKLIQFQSLTQNKCSGVYNFYPICIKFDKKKAKK